MKKKLKKERKTLQMSAGGQRMRMKIKKNNIMAGRHAVEKKT